MLVTYSPKRLFSTLPRATFTFHSSLLNCLHIQIYKALPIKHFRSLKRTLITDSSKAITSNITDEIRIAESDFHPHFNSFYLTFLVAWKALSLNNIAVKISFQNRRLPSFNIFPPQSSNSNNIRLKNSSPKTKISPSVNYKILIFFMFFFFAGYSSIFLCI